MVSTNWALLLLGIYRFCMHKMKGALQDFDEIISTDVDDTQNIKIEALTERACLKLSTGDIDGAEQDFEMAIIIDPKNATTYHKRAKFGRHRFVRRL